MICYETPAMEEIFVIAEGILCSSLGGGTDEFNKDDSWSDIFGG